uniref:Scaffoldin C n=1 Tax=Ruminococcus flavefaciens TaxID=1265 RepID=G9FF63_RUMFL|nr:scaffoldin C [Ruminococcus flavefaciens]
MKTKKIVIGAMAAAMLSLSLTSLAPATAADETVQISVSEAEAQAGGTFTVEVSLADIPATAIQANFAFTFDSSVLQITDITAGPITETGADKADDTASEMPTFNTYISNAQGWASVMWSTKLTDPAYLIKNDGVFCTISGTVAENAPDGKSEIKVVPTDRETFDGSGVANDIIDMGYKSNDGYVQYQVKTNDGGVVIGTATSGKYLKGDADCSGDVSISDVVTVLQYAANKAKYLLMQKVANADVDGNGVVDANDAFEIQVYDATKEWLH